MKLLYIYSLVMLKVYCRRYVPGEIWRLFILNIEFGGKKRIWVDSVFCCCFSSTTWNFLYHFFDLHCFKNDAVFLMVFLRDIFSDSFFFLSLVFRSLIIMHISMDSFGFTQFKVHHNLLGFLCGSVVKNLQRVRHNWASELNWTEGRQV